MVYHRTLRKILLFGGVGGDATPRLAETWSWDGGDKSWTVIHTKVSPLARAGHGMVYDSMRQRVVMFGGDDTKVCLGDTWQWLF